MEIMKKWFLLLPLISIQWASLTKLTQLIAHILLVSTAQDQILPLGTIYIPMAMISTQIEEHTMEINMVANRNNLFSNGLCTIPDIWFARVNFQQNINLK